MDEYGLQASFVSFSQGPRDWLCIPERLSLTSMWMQQQTGNDCYFMFVDMADTFQWFGVTQQQDASRLYTGRF